MRKRIWIPLTVVALAAAEFFELAPGYLESSINPASAEAKIDGNAVRAIRAGLVLRI